MTRNHLYFLSSNIDYSKQLSEDVDFEPVYEYHPDEIKKVSGHEFGRIKTNSNYFHLLLGNPPQKGCPWCGTEPTLKKITTTDCCPGGPQPLSRYTLKCTNCGASGPIMNVLEACEIEKKYMDEVKDRMKRSFESRRAWECDFEGLK